MERHASESRVLQEILETNRLSKFTSDIEKFAVLDAFAQFSQNPTSMSAGYGIEKNYLLIGENLAKRYELGKVTIETILTFLKESFDKMREVNYEIYFWREAIADYINEKYVEEFLNWYESLYKNLSEKEKIKFLFLLGTLTRTNSTREIHKWFGCFFDKEEKSSESDVSDLLVQFGIGNILYYKSTSGNVENQFAPVFFKNYLLEEEFELETPVEEEQVEEFFDNLSLTNVKLLEKCVKETIPILESRMGKVTQISPLILETSKSYFAISPFALDKFSELLKVKKLELTKEWKKRFDLILNAFLKEVYPCAELKFIFEIDGAYCWEIKYTDSSEKEPISVCILLSPYLFNVSSYSTILDEMRRTVPSQLNLIFLIEETLPTITESFRYVSQKNLIYLLNEKKQKFYAVERSEKLQEDKASIVDRFLSRFFSLLEKEIQISKTWPSHLRDYMDNLRYFNKFPRLVEILNKIPAVELKLRKAIRLKFERKFEARWNDKIKEKFLNKIGIWEGRIEKRLDREDIKDFLDGATLGELLEITRNFHDVMELDRGATGHLNVITQYRSILVHQLKEQETDLDERKYNTLKLALDYVEKVICLE